MPLNIEELFLKSGCRIVFVEDPGAARAVEEAVLSRQPAYKTEIHEVFDVRKKKRTVFV